MGLRIPIISNMFDPPKVDTTQANEDRQRALDLYNQSLAAKAGQQTYIPPQVGVNDVHANDVTAVNTGPIERVNAGSVTAPADVHLGGTAQGVTAQQVAAPGAATAFTAPGAQIMDQAGQQVRGQQMSYLDALKARSMGQGPSVAQEQQNRALGNITATQTGLAAQAHGNQGVFARREAMRNIADAQQKTSLDAGLLRANEVTQATGQLGGALNDVRGTDTGVAVHQADLNQGANINNSNLATGVSQFNKELALRAATGNADRSLAAGTTTALAQNARDVDVANVGAANANRGIGVATGNVDRSLAAAGANATAANANETANANRLTETAVGNAQRNLAGQTSNQGAHITAEGANQGAGLQAQGQRITESGQLSNNVIQANQQAMGGTAQVAGIQAGNQASQTANDAAIIKGATAAGAAVSDERVKTDIKTDSTADVDQFFKALEEHSYKYKNPADGIGTRHGPMAQELEKSDIGRSAVQTGPDGVKRVDTNAFVLALAGAVARKLRGRGADAHS